MSWRQIEKIDEKIRMMRIDCSEQRCEWVESVRLLQQEKGRVSKKRLVFQGPVASQLSSAACDSGSSPNLAT